MKKNTWWCPYDPIKKEWWGHWLRSHKKILMDELWWESRYDSEGVLEVVGRLQIKRVKIVEIT